MMKRLLLSLLITAGLASATVVQSAKGTRSTAGNPSLTLPGSSSSGNFIIVTVAAYGVPSSLSGVTDSAGNSYTLITSAEYSTSSHNHMAMYWAKAGTSATLTITANVSNTGGDSTIMAAEIANTLTGTSADIDVSTNLSYFTGTTAVSPAIATTSTNEDILAFAANNGSQFVSPGSGFTQIQNACCFSQEASILEYRSVTTTGSYTASVSAAASVNWGMVVVGVKVAAAPATTPTIGPTGVINMQPSGSKNVKTDCGAAGNGSTNDSTAINNCITSLAAGQTLYFPDGTYMVGTGITFKAGHTYLGHSSNTILKQITNGNTIAATDSVVPLNIVIDTITFDGGTMYFNGPSTGTCGITIQNSTFQNNTARPPGSFESAMFIMGEKGAGGCSQGVRIHNNLFKNLLYNGQTRADIPGHTNWPNYDGDVPRSAIWLYGADRTSIDHNIFDNVYQGIKVCFVHTYSDSNPYVGYNIFNKIHRMPMELQGPNGCGPHPDGVEDNNLTIEYNYLHDWNDYFWESYGISMADVPQNGIVRNNFIVGSRYEDPNPGIGYEVGGAPLHVYNNVGMGPWGLGVGIFDGSVNPEANNNWLCQLDSTVRNTSPKVACEQCGQWAAPVNPNYHDNYLHNTCNPAGVGGITPSTSISLGSPSVASGTLSANSTTMTFNPSISTVSYYVDGSATPISAGTISPYTLLNSVNLNHSLNAPTTGLSAGSHTLVAKAMDVWGNTWTSNSQSFTVTVAPTLTTPFQLIGDARMVGAAALIGAGGDGTLGSIGGTHTLSGFIGGPPSLSVSISGSGIGSNSTTATPSGYYKFTNLPNGTYTITPGAVSGYSFSPSSVNATISGADNTASDLVATTTLAKFIHDNEVGLHEAPTDGIPPTWDGALGTTTSGTLQNSIGTHQAVLPWFSLQVAPGGNPATNVIVNVRNMKMCVLSGSGTPTWSCTTYNANQIEGEWDSEDFSNFVGSWNATDLGDGTATIPMHTGFTACNGADPTYSQTQNCVSHFYPDTRKAVNPATIVGFVAYVEARVIKNNPAGVDDRSLAKVLLIPGADAYNSTTSNDDPDVRPPIGYGKYKYVQGEWRGFAMTTLTEAQLNSNPPPITITGIAP